MIFTTSAVTQVSPRVQSAMYFTLLAVGLLLNHVFTAAVLLSATLQVTTLS